MPIPYSDQATTGDPSGPTATTGPRRAGPSAMVRTAGPTRSTIDASGVWCAASFAIATITCVPSTRSLRLNEAPVPILPMRLEYHVIDEATLPCSGSTAVAANETLTPRSTEAPVAGLVMVTTGARLVVGARAAAALTMPPVATLPVRLLIGRTVARMRSRICETVHVGCAASSSAATPATCGLAIDVPSANP